MDQSGLLPLRRWNSVNWLTRRISPPVSTTLDFQGLPSALGQSLTPSNRLEHHSALSASSLLLRPQRTSRPRPMLLTTAPSTVTEADSTRWTTSFISRHSPYRSMFVLIGIENRQADTLLSCTQTPETNMCPGAMQEAAAAALHARQGRTRPEERGRGRSTHACQPPPNRQRFVSLWNYP